jgi:hypothetical protein
MATPLTITCPKCNKTMKVPAEAVGKKVRCKGCQHIFAVKAPEPAAPVNPATEHEEDANPYKITTLDLTPRCPNCANELESEDAVICLHCGYNTMSRQYVGTKKTFDTTGGDIFLWLLPGILCVVAVLLLIGFALWYALAMKDLVAGEGWLEFFGSGACVLWVIIISLFGIFFAGKFAFKRLLIDNKPPEVEKF